MSAHGDVTELTTDLMIITRALMEQITDEDNKKYFEIFLKDLFVDSVLAEDPSKSIMNHIFDLFIGGLDETEHK